VIVLVCFASVGGIFHSTEKQVEGELRRVVLLEGEPTFEPWKHREVFVIQNHSADGPCTVSVESTSCSCIQASFDGDPLADTSHPDSRSRKIQPKSSANLGVVLVVPKSKSIDFGGKVIVKIVTATGDVYRREFAVEGVFFSILEIEPKGHVVSVNPASSICDYDVVVKIRTQAGKSQPPEISMTDKWCKIQAFEFEGMIQLADSVFESSWRLKIASVLPSSFKEFGNASSEIFAKYETVEKTLPIHFIANEGLLAPLKIRIGRSHSSVHDARKILVRSASGRDFRVSKATSSCDWVDVSAPAESKNGQVWIEVQTSLEDVPNQYQNSTIDIETDMGILSIPLEWK